MRPRVVELLKAEGFGILTEIDVAATLREKLDADALEAFADQETA